MSPKPSSNADSAVTAAGVTAAPLYQSETSTQLPLSSARTPNLSWRTIAGFPEKGPCSPRMKTDIAFFWDRICTIHPVKPQMCRRWPFIESVLRDVANWRIMASMCPGMMAEAPGSRVEECVRKAFRDESTDSIKRRHQEATGSPYPKTVSSGEPPSPCTRSGHSHRIKRGR